MRRVLSSPTKARRTSAKESTRSELAAMRRPRKRSRPYQHAAASARRRKKVSHSLLHGRRGQLDAEFLAQGDKARIVAVFENKRCYHQLGQTGIVGGVSIVEPAEHFIWFFAKSVDNGN